MYKTFTLYIVHASHVQYEHKPDCNICLLWRVHNKQDRVPSLHYPTFMGLLQESRGVWEQPFALLGLAGSAIDRGGWSSSTRSGVWTEC